MTNIQSLLDRVHLRVGGGIEILTFDADRTVEIRWKTFYPEHGWSEDRWIQARGLAEALQAVLDYEDDEDARIAEEEAEND